MKKKCENCHIGKRFKRLGFQTEDEFIICYFQCNFNKEGGNWKNDEEEN